MEPGGGVGGISKARSQPKKEQAPRNRVSEPSSFGAAPAQGNLLTGSAPTLEDIFLQQRNF